MTPGTMAHMRSDRLLVGCTLPWLLASCVETLPPQPAPVAVSAQQACKDLHAAAPHEWTERLAPVYALGQKAEVYLIEELERTPSAPGAQASIAALGHIGGRVAVAHCRQLVLERAPLAVEAALALGELDIANDDEVLLDCMLDHHSDVVLRTAAACSLVRHGETERAPRYLGAIVRAGTPAGRADEQAFGLPVKTRWARERYFVQRTLRALGHDDLCEALDTDAPWPTLEALAPKIAARLTQK